MRYLTLFLAACDPNPSGEADRHRDAEPEGLTIEEYADRFTTWYCDACPDEFNSDSECVNYHDGWFFGATCTNGRRFNPEDGALCLELLEAEVLCVDLPEPCRVAYYCMPQAG